MTLLRFTVLAIAVTIGLTDNAVASPDDEFRQFRDAAVQILFPRGLYLIDPETIENPVADVNVNRSRKVALVTIVDIPVLQRLLIWP